MKLSHLFSAGLLVLGALFPAQAVTFGGLNVTPRGAQNLNLETGATEMPQGGVATDARGGLTLSAARMQLRPGNSLTAQNATLKTRSGGVLNAAQMVYDLKAGTVTASGTIRYSDARLSGLGASKMVIDVQSGFVVASGRVQASQPPLSSQSLVFDPSTMQAVLTGPYTLTTPQGAQKGAANSRALLTFAGNKLVRLRTAPAAQELSRFARYLH